MTKSGIPTAETAIEIAKRKMSQYAATAMGLYRQHFATIKNMDSGIGLPIPSGRYTRVTNTAFSYTITYPAEWKQNTSQDQVDFNVYVPLANADGPGIPGIEISCASNPSQLTAQQWWASHTSPFDFEIALGNVTLSSGVQVYKTKAQQDMQYEPYTAVHADKACNIVNDKHGTRTGQPTSRNCY